MRACVCERDLSCKFDHKLTGMLNTTISLKVLSCILNCKVSKMLMQEEQPASVTYLKEFGLMAILVKIANSAVYET